MCFGVRRGVCVWCEREEVILVRAHLRVRIHPNKELDDFGPGFAAGSRQVRHEV